MNLNDIVTDEPVLVDANILLYAIRNESPQCQRFLTRCALGEIIGILPMHVLSEIMHRLMIAEARENGWITGANPAKQLASKPERIRLLTRYEKHVRDILVSGLRFEHTEREDFLEAFAIQHSVGLLTNDAIFAAIAKRLRIQTFVSADASLARVEGMILYRPDDVKSTTS